MALVLGHSQVKYVGEVFKNDRVVTLCYPGYRVRDFIDESTPFDVIPFVSVVALVVGANDLPRSTPDDIVHDVLSLCDEIRSVNPSVTVILMEILPRAQNLFPGCRLTQQFLSNFNAGATSVNDRLREIARQTKNVEFVETGEFQTRAGPNRKMLSRDGLHLSFQGTGVLASHLETTITDCLKSTSARSTPKPSRPSTQPLPRVVEGPRLYSEVAATTSQPPSVTTRSPPSQPPSVTTRSPPSQPPSVTTRSPPSQPPSVTTRSPPSQPPSVTTRSPPSQPPSVTTRSPPSQPPSVTTRSPPSQPPSVTTRSPPSQPPSVTTRSPPSQPPSVTTRSPPSQPPSVTTRSPPSQPPSSSPSSKSSAELTEIDEVVKWINGDLKKKPSCLTGGGIEAIVYENRHKPLTTKLAINIFKLCEKGESTEKISQSIPLSGKGGEVYVVDTHALSNRKDIFIDMYVWKNDGRKKYPEKDPSIYKSLFKLRLPDKTCSKSFQKNIYEMIQNDQFIIIHYLGSEDVFEPFAHGNCKNSTRVFKRTCPSVFDQLVSKSDDLLATANNVYKQSKSTAEKGIDLGIKTASNLKQVKNHMYKARKEKKLSDDDLYNLLEISYELDDFNKQIDIFPSLVCISGMKEILDEFNELLLFESKEKVKLYYDTTYKLGELFVSVLSFQHIIFEGAPVIPVAFMMHTKRNTKFHERFFSVLKEHVPNLKKTMCPIICDREPGIKAAVHNVLPNIPVVHCWLHMKKDIKIWLQKQSATQDDLSVYINHVDTLLRSESEESFLSQLAAFEEMWTVSFRNYFHKHIKPSIIENSGRWILNKLGIYNHYSGITTNAAESVNNVLKSVQNRRELPLDMMNITFYYLQQYHYTEMQCGRAGFGTLSLKSDFSYAKLSPDEIKVPQINGSPDEIIKLAKARLDMCRQTRAANVCDSDIIIENANISEHSSEPNIIPVIHHESEVNGTSKITQNEKHESSDELLNTIDDKDVTILDDKTESERKGPEKLITQNMLADHIIKENKIHWVASMNAFLVEGIKGSKRVVTIIPKETCSCPSTGMCYHILAVKTAFNLNTGHNTKTVKNLSLLRKNSKPRVAKKTGQKKPKRADFEVIAAPDSVQKTQLIKTPTTNRKRKNNIDESESRKKIKSEESSVRKEIKFEELPCTIEKQILPDILEDSFETRLSDIEDSPFWCEKHNLTEDDKHLIENSTGWLNDKIINAAQCILKTQYKKTNGLQDTLLVPKFIDNANKWNVSKYLSNQKPPSAQIHHNGKSHWLLSFQTSESETINIIDSLKSQKTVNSSISIQLAQIYGSSSNQINTCVRPVQQQDNGSDCGIFAIAFLTERLHSNFSTDLSGVRFNILMLRQHLLECIENDSFTPFPRIGKMPKMPHASPKIQKTKLYCQCKLPDFVEDMVRCENKSCRTKWYHKSCVDVKSDDVDFLCVHCSW